MAALDATDFEGDLLEPAVSQFILDLDAGSIRISFNEVVYSDIFNATSIALQTSELIGTPSGTNYYSFSSLTQQPDTSLNNLTDIIILSMTRSDTNALKTHSLLGLNGSTFATFNDAITYDSSSHPLTGAANGNAFEVIVTPDTSPPVITSVYLDLDSGDISLSFDEPINSSTLDATVITITNSTVLPQSLFTVSDYTLRPIINSTSLTSRLSSSEAAVLIETLNGTSNSFISFNQYLIADIFGNYISPMSDLRVDVFIPDQTSPTLDQFTLDMDIGLLTLVFSEAVRGHTFNTSAITIQGGSTSSNAHTLSSLSVPLQINSTTFQVNLTSDDLSGIKAAPYTATSLSNTYITLSDSLIRDLYGNRNAPILNGSARQAAELITDDVNPQLISFSFGNYEGRVTLSLTFTEVINASSVNPSQLTLQLDSTMGSGDYTLVSSTPLLVHSDIIHIPIGDADLLFILSLPSNLARTRDDTFISFPTTFAADMQGNLVESVPNTGAIQSTTEPGDIRPPQLNSFILNLNTGTMTLTFSETVTPTSFVPQAITLQSSMSGGNSYTLTGGNATAVNNVTIFVQLLASDVNAIQADSMLAIDRDTTYVSLSRGVMLDTDALAVLPILSTSALQATNFTENEERPELIGFTLSLSSNDPLTLTFSETVIASMLRIEQFTLLSAPSVSALTFKFRTPLTITPSAGAILNLTLNLTDKSELQQRPGIGTVIENTYLSVTAGAITDSNGDSLVAIPISSAIRANLVIPDTLPPALNEASLDMNQGLLTLVGSEPVQESSVNPNSITLQSSPTDPTASYTLQSSSLNRLTDFVNMVIRISEDDLNGIKAVEICTNSSNCYVTHDEDSFRDTFGEPSLNLTTGLSVSLTLDITPPRLVSFNEFNRATGSLTISFSETIDSSSFNASGVILQNLFDSANDVSMYTLTGGSVTDNNVSLTISLTSEDMAAVRLNPYLCTSRGNCYIRLTSTAFTDVTGNEVDPTDPALLVDRFTFDNVRPRLLNFTLDLETNQLQLLFSEPVSGDSFNASGLYIRSSNDTTDDEVRLLASSTLSSDGSHITVDLSTSDLNAIKDSGFATSISDTYLSMMSTTTKDLALVPNSVQEIPSDESIQAYDLIPDNTPPQLIDFSFNLNDDTFTLTFNEPIVSEMIDFSKFSITGEGGTPSIPLTTASVLSVNVGSTVAVSVKLSMSDIISLKTTSNVATNVNDTFLSISSNSFTDIAGNPFAPISLQPAQSYTPDTSGPELQSFVLNLEDGLLTLTFTDVIDPNRFDPTGITLQDSSFRSSNAHYTLTSASTPSLTFGYTLVITLNSDALPIRENNLFGTNRDNTYITMTASTIDGPAGDDNVAITNGKALQASNVTFDSAPPEFLSFNLDMDDGIMTLTFTDFILSGSVNVSGILLQNQPKATPGRTYRLTGGGTLAITEATLTITLSQTDLNGIKANTEVATTMTNTYITLSASVIQDTSINNLLPIPDGDGRQVSSFTPDGSRPELTEFVLDRDRGTLLLTFNEVVNIPDFFYPEEVRLLNRQNVNLGVATIVSLSGSTFVSNSILQTAELRLPIPILNSFSTDFGDMVMNTYLSITVFAVSDMNNNPIKPISATNALQAEDVILDTTSPSLESFQLDLSLNVLILTWSKPVNVSTLTAISDISIQDDQTRTHGYSLTTSSVTSDSGAVMNIQLSGVDANALKTSNNFATTINNTFITVSGGFVEDIRGRASVAINDGSAQQALIFNPDTQPPMIVSFNLDLNNGTLDITFDEFVTNFDADLITIFNSTLASSSNVSFSNSSISSISSNIVSIDIGEIDLEALKADTTLATNSLNTFIGLSSGSVSDIFNNTLSDLVISASTGTVQPDTGRPLLESFRLDLSTEILALTFSEAVDVNSINFNGLTIQNTQSTMPTSEYTLTSSSTILSSSGPIIEIHLIGTDASAIKADASIGTTVLDTYISINESFANDTSGNRILEILPESALQASFVGNDSSPPRLQSFTLDLANNIIQFRFSEAINISTFTPTEIALFSGLESSDISYTLTGGTVPDTNAAIFNLSLSIPDASYLKEQAQTGLFASTRSNTFITLNSSLANDTSGNAMEAVPKSDLFPPTAIYQDTAGPLVVSFTLDLNNGNLTLQFSEQINSSTFRGNYITLRGSNTNTANHYNISTTTITSISNLETVISMTLSLTDLNGIKGQEICNQTTDCYLTHLPSLVIDNLGNVAQGRQVPMALQASDINMDINAPTYEEYVALDLDEGILRLRFSETMYGQSANFRSLTLSNSDSSASHTLTGGTVISSVTETLVIQLSLTDLNAIKALTSLCTSAFNCRPSFTSNFITDFAGNEVQSFALSPFNFFRHIAQSFTQDTTSLTLERFELDLEAETLTLTFDEVAGFVTAQRIYIQDAFNATRSYKLTTESVQFPNSLSATINLNDVDVFTLKATGGLAQDTLNTYITHDTGLARDTQTNQVIARVDGVNPLRAAYVANDTTPPTFVRFDSLDFNGNYFEVEFSEPVDPESFVPSLWSFHSAGTGGTTIRLTGGTASFSSSDDLFKTLRINFADTDLIKLENNTFIATLMANSYLSFETGAISDFSDNEISSATPPTRYQVQTAPVLDGTAPSLSTYTLDMNTNSLILTFDDTVIASTFDATAITLRGADSGSSASYTLTGGVTNSSNGFTIFVPLLPSDVDQLRLRPSLATNASNTYLSMTSSVITGDRGGNAIAITEPALAVTTFISDITPPTLQNFTFSFDDGQIFLYFSEIMSTITYTPRFLSIQSSENYTNDTSSYTFTGGIVTLGTPNTVLIVNISEADLNGLKVNRELATELSKTYISISSGAFTDTAGNPAVPILPSDALQASSFEADVVPPYIESIVLDLQLGALLLEFSEAVTAPDFLTLVKLQNRLTLPSINLNPPLDAEVVIQSGSSTVELRFEQSSLNTLKLNPDIATSRDNTFMQLETDLITDYGGYSLNSTLPSVYLTAIDVINDTVGPQIVSYTLNLNTGLLSFTFDEFVNVSTLNTSVITILNPSNGNVLSQLGQITSTSENGRTVSITLSESDVNAINSEPNLQTVSIDTSPGLVQDILSNPSDSQTDLRPSELVSDETPPQIEEYSLDMNNGELVVNFTEAITSSTFNLSQVTLSSSTDGATTYSLTNGSFSISGRMLTVTISPTDINNIKLTGSIGLSESSTYLSLTDGAVTDLKGNAITGISNTPATILYSDTVSPQLLGFSISYANDNKAPINLTLTFSEPVNSSSLIFSELSLHNTSNASGSSYVLASSTINTEYTFHVSITISNDDLVGIQGVNNLAVYTNNTYISITSSAISDVFGNGVQAIPALIVTPPLPTDISPPSLISFYLNVETENLTLVFDQPVDLSTFNATHITIQSSMSSNAISYLFRGGPGLSTDSPTTVYMPIDSVDVNGLKSVDGLAESAETTFISLTEGLVKDLSGHNALAISSNSALNVSGFTADTTNPQLTSFTVNMNPGQPIILTFSEPILASSLNLEEFLLQNHETSPTRIFNLSSIAQPITENSAVITIYLNFDVRESILTFTDIATSTSNTYIKVASTAATDTVDRPLVAATIQASSVISGNLPPSVSQFNFDMNTGTITLNFDKTVVGTTLNFNYFSLQDTADSPNAVFNFSGTRTANDVNEFNQITSLSVTLYFEDLNSIKETLLCDSQSDCFLAYADGAFADTFELNALNSSKQVTNYVSDSVAPLLQSFVSFDISSGQLQLSFNEPVNASSFDAGRFQLRSLFSSDSLSVYTLTGGSATASGNTLSIQLSSEDLAAIQIDNNICSWRGNCYISVTSGAIRDPADNPVATTSQASLIVQTYITDSSHPSLENYTLNLNTNTLFLTFSEAVDISTYTGSGISLLPSNDSADLITLTSSTATGSSGTIITVSLTPSEANALKSSELIATGTIFLTMTNNTIRDLSLSPNLVSPITDDDPLQGVYIPDGLQPVFNGFSLDLNEDTLSLTFNEPIDLTRLSIPNMRLVASSSPVAASIPLTTSAVLSDSITDTHVITISLSPEDALAIKGPSVVANDASSTYIRISPNTAYDTTGNGNTAEYGPVRVQTYVPDTTKATLSSFRLDMTSGTLYLTFNDIIDTSTFHPPGVILQSSNVRQEGSYYRLTNASTTPSIFGYEMIISLSSDLYGIKSVGSVGNSINTTYITLQADTVDDSFDEDIVAVTDGKAIIASDVTSDITRPSLESFSLDVNTGELTLTFDDVISPQTFDVSGITIQNNANISEGDSYTLTTDTTFTRLGTGFRVLVTLAYDDFNGIKSLLQRGAIANNTFISITEDTATDSAFNLVVPIFNTSAQAASSLTPDDIRPTLLNFNLDLNQATLTLTFSETVDINAVDITGITLQDTSGENITVSLPLASGVLYTTQHSFIVTIGLVDTDFALVSSSPNIGTTINNTYLALAARSFSDTSGNRVIPIPTSAALQAQSITNDTTAPELVRYDFSLDTGTLFLTFTEAVDLTSLNASELTIQQIQNSSLGGETLTLSGGESYFVSPKVVAVELLNSDLNIIKESGILAASESSTYISFTSSLFTDYSDNQISPLSPEQGLRATNYIPDTSSPIITTYSIDFDNMTITVSFDELIDPTSIDIASGTQGLFFQNSLTAPDSQISLNSSTIEVLDNFTFIIRLSTDDMNDLKAQPGFGLFNTTFINVSRDFVRDIYGNGLDPQVSEVTSISPDTVNPRLTEFSVDLDVGNLLLTFTETVNAQSLNTTAILLQNGLVGSTQYHRLSSDATPTSANGPVVVVELSSYDLTQLQSMMQLATNTSNTFLILSSNAIDDIYGNPSDPVIMAERASDLFTDMTRPRLLAFDLNLSDNTLTLSYSETVSLQSFNPQSLTLLNHVLNFTVLIPLTGGDVITTANSDTIVLRLDLDDLSSLKTNADIGQVPSQTFLSATEGSAIDLYGFNATALSPIRVTSLVQDTVPPQLLSFDLSLVNNSISLTFDEPVNFTSFDELAITLQSSAYNASETLPLTGGVSTLDKDYVITLEFNPTDLFNLNIDTDLCSNSTNCYITALTGLITDVSGNEYIEDPTPLPVTSFVTDTTRPFLLKFDYLDLDEGVMRLNISEPLNPSLVVFNELRLQNSPDSSVGSLTLSGGSARITGSALDITLTRSDLDSLKANTALCTIHIICWVYFTSDFAVDVSGNPIIEPTLSFAAPIAQVGAGNIIADNSPPEVIGFDIDFNNNTLTIEFDETVSTSSFNVEDITFSNNDSSTSYTIQASDSATVTLSPNSPFIQVIIPDSLINKIKSTCQDDTDYTTCLGINRDSTYIVFTDGLVNDPVPNAYVGSSEPVQVRNFVTDTEPPSLESFESLNLNDFSLTVKFTEPVILPVNLSYFTLQSQSATGNQVPLSSAVSSEYADVTNDKSRIKFTLSRDDIASIKLGPGAGKSEAESHIFVAGGAASDFSGFSSLPRNSTNALRVSSFTSDTINPSLTNFSIDLNTGYMSLTFNDVVDVSTLNPIRITLRSNLTDTPSDSIYTLTGGTSPSDDGFIINLRFSDTDLNQIKSLTALAVSDTTTYITITPDTIEDVFTNAVNRISATDALAAGSIIPDTTRPTLDDFTVDLHNENLILLFSEVIDVLSLDVTQITLQNSALQSTFTTSFTLTGGIVLAGEFARSVTINFTDVDLNEIKRLHDLATDLTDSYISITSALVHDTANNPVVPIYSFDALNASVVRPDLQPPQLISFTLNMDNGLLVLTFDETVNSTTLNVSSIIIQNSFTSSGSESYYTLTDGSVSTSTSDLDGDHVLLVNISNDDLNELKARLTLATGIPDTFIRFLEDGVSDNSGNGIAQIRNGEAIKATNYSVDNTAPSLLGFDINLTDDTITLTFTETVLPDSFTPSALTILSNTSSDIELQLTTSNVSSSIGPVLVIQLSPQDSIAIKSEVNLASNINNTYISFNETLITDAVSISVIPIPPESAVIADSYEKDTLPPSLLCTTLNMNDGLLSLSFDEPVDPNSINASHLTILSSNSTYVLTGGQTSSSPGTVIHFQLKTEDVNAIKEDLLLARGNDSTFFTFTPSFITDTSGVEVVPQDTVQVCQYIRDTQSPEIESFDVIMVNGDLPLIVRLHFTESINISTFDSRSITLLSSSDANAEDTISYTLNSGSFVMENTADLDVITTEFDFSGLRLHPPILESINSTYLFVPGSAFYDIEGNPGITINSSAALKVSTLDVDLTAPDLLEFNLDLNVGVITLTYNQALDPSTANFTLLTLQNDAINSTSSYTLTAGNATFLDPDNNKVLLVTIDQTDLNIIKFNRELAISKDTTYISALSSFIKGDTGTPSSLVPTNRAVPVTQFTPDFSRPRLVSYDVYINSMMVILTFSESVRLSSFEPQQITFQNAISNPTSTYKLTGGNSSQTINNIIVLHLTEIDENAIKAFDDLLTVSNDTFLSATAQLVEDTTGNAMEPVRDSNALQVTYYGMDADQPYLESFSLDLSLERLTLSFNETVNPLTIDVSSITLYESLDNDSISYNLISGQPIDTSLSAQVVIQLSREDASLIKSLSLCSNTSNCYLTHTSELVDDVIQMSVIERDISDALQASSVLSDSVSPTLLSFDIDMDEGSLTLSFSEIVDISKFNFSAIRLQTFFSQPYTSVDLTNGSLITQSDSLNVTFSLDSSDLIAIQSTAQLCSTRGTCYITLSSSLVTDLAGNAIQSITDGPPGKVSTGYIPDTTDPNLTGFTLDLNSNQLLLTFDEAVDPTSFQATGVSIQSTSNINDNGTSIVNLSSASTPVDGNSEVLIINLSRKDRDAIKSSFYATDVNNTFITLSANSLSDTSLSPNSVSEINNTHAFQASNVISDKTPPLLEEFSLNLNDGTLLLTFTEPVSFNSFDHTLVDLLSEPDSTYPFTLSGATVLVNDIYAGSSVLTVSLEPEDVQYIKFNTSLGSSPANTYLRLYTEAVTDTTGNSYNTTSTTEASQVILDTTSASLIEFTFNTNTGQLNLTFNDVVILNSFNPDAITFQNAPLASPGKSLTLTTYSSIDTLDHYTIIVVLDILELIQLKTIEGIATDVNDTYLTMGAHAIRDHNNNDILAITDGNGLQASDVVPDNISPDISGFEFDLNTGILSITFTDTIKQDTFNVQEITLQSASNNDTDNYITLHGAQYIAR